MKKYMDFHFDEPYRRRRRRRFIISFVCVLAFLAGAATGIYGWMNMHYDSDIAYKIEKTGFTEHQAVLPDGSVINYGKGPANNKPPLLLIHGQMVSWEDYVKVLPRLSSRFHVFAVDCYGHGGSDKNPDKYSCASNGADLVWFIREVIGEPAIVSGHSSGGIIATWIAANAPDDVLALVIEDAPYFSTERGRIEQTFSYLDGFAPIHEYLNQTQEENYTRWYLEHCYMQNLWKDAWVPMVSNPARKQMEKNPNTLPRLWYLPAAMNKVFDMTGCIQNETGQYDLFYGDAFYTGSWFDGVDQTEILRSVTCPSVLLHTAAPGAAPSYYDEEGVLLAAMDKNDAKRAHNLLGPDAIFIDNVKSGHNIHDENPSLFVDAIVRSYNVVKSRISPTPLPILQTGRIWTETRRFGRHP